MNGRKEQENGEVRSVLKVLRGGNTKTTLTDTPRYYWVVGVDQDLKILPPNKLNLNDHDLIAFCIAHGLVLYRSQTLQTS
jgi:hypothetical protein